MQKRCIDALGLRLRIPKTANISFSKRTGASRKVECRKESRIVAIAPKDTHAEQNAKPNMINAIEERAHRILEQMPEPVVRYRLLREVLKRPADDIELCQAKEALRNSCNVQELADEQWADGGWGAFHSRSTRLKQRIPSTEFGVERALALGLDPKHPVLEKTTRYLLSIIDGETPFPDYHEKNDRWQTGMRLLLASTLSLIHPQYPVLDKDRKLWISIAEMTFRTGKYCEEDEIKAHAKLTGATVKGSYLVLNNRYQLNILGSIPGMLPMALERSLLQWLWERPNGIGYLEMPLHHEPPNHPAQIDRWLASLELLARCFPSWVTFAQSSIEWLWNQQNPQGYWDLGARPSSLSNLPLSDDWRKKNNRVFDWTTRILTLLRKYHEAVP
jgi:hypothetical protein